MVEKIYARKCSISQISNEIAKQFLTDNHRHGAIRLDATYKLGLYYNDVIVGVAIWGNPRTAKKAKQYSRELLRMAFKKDVRVIGGASKLIKRYINDKNPADFFTYQDTAGENTRVYEHCGMVLVKDGTKSKKQYLVAPGKTLDTANRKEALGMAYATRYGPDRILGTKLGEVYDDAGSRKSNKRLFLEDLNWHVEETTADSVWEWINPNVSFYLYKIVSSQSDGYYIGRRKINMPSPTVEDCLADKYLGSGGVKFQNWLASVEPSTVQKIILSIVDTKAQAVIEEEELIGDLYKTDKNCKNSYSGGTGYAAISWENHFKTDSCKIHGETTFFAKTCCKCRNQKLISQDSCEIHGEVTHQAGICCQCTAARAIAILSCDFHGETKHIGSSCYKCAIEKQWTKELCTIHGKTSHQGGKCKKCLTLEKFNQKNCSKHGLVTFYGDSCRRCHVEGNFSQKICKTHGVTTHQGDTCAKCAAAKKDHISVCAKHGEVRFQYSKCSKCIQERRDSLKDCPKHGRVKHRGDACYRCTLEKANGDRECEKHGLTAHRGNTCCKCSSEKAAHRRFHEKKGVVKDGCSYCEKAASATVR